MFCRLMRGEAVLDETSARRGRAPLLADASGADQGRVAGRITRSTMSSTRDRGGVVPSISRCWNSDHGLRGAPRNEPGTPTGAGGDAERDVPQGSEQAPLGDRITQVGREESAQIAERAKTAVLDLSGKACAALHRSLSAAGAS